MDVQTFPDSVKKLFEEARTNFDQALQYQEQGNHHYAKQRAEAAMRLLAQVAEATSGYAKDQQLLLEMIAKGYTGFARTETEESSYQYADGKHICNYRYKHDSRESVQVKKKTIRMEVIK